jgi:sigma-B regulation protein RsbU (phosphoserine phosphatase)
MASMQAAIRALAPLGMPLGALVTRVNNMIVESTPHDAFITAFLALLDPASGVVEYVNAGHNPPLHTIDGETGLLTEGGPLLGVIPTIAPYPSGRIELTPGESLLFYTDGVSEGMDGMRRLYGEERLAALVGSHTRSTAMEILTAIRHDLDDHVGAAPRSDDITLLCVKRLEVVDELHSLVYEGEGEGSGE